MHEYHASPFIFDPTLAQMQCRSYHPFERYPEIQTDRSGSPISCQGEALESDPQLAIANQMAATFGNYLVWSWFGMPHKPDMIDYKPVGSNQRSAECKLKQWGTLNMSQKYVVNDNKVYEVNDTKLFTTYTELEVPEHNITPVWKGAEYHSLCGTTLSSSVNTRTMSSSQKPYLLVL